MVPVIIFGDKFILNQFYDSQTHLARYKVAIDLICSTVYLPCFFLIGPSRESFLLSSPFSTLFVP